MSLEIGRVDGDGLEGEEHVGEEEGGGGMDREVKGVEGLRVEEVRISRVGE